MSMASIVGERPYWVGDAGTASEPQSVARRRGSVAGRSPNDYAGSSGEPAVSVPRTASERKSTRDGTRLGRSSVFPSSM